MSEHERVRLVKRSSKVHSDKSEASKSEAPIKRRKITPKEPKEPKEPKVSKEPKEPKEPKRKRKVQAISESLVNEATEAIKDKVVKKRTSKKPIAKPKKSKGFFSWLPSFLQ